MGRQEIDSTKKEKKTKKKTKFTSTQASRASLAAYQKQHGQQDHDQTIFSNLHAVKAACARKKSKNDRVL